MTKKFSIVAEINPRPEKVGILSQGIIAYAREKKGQKPLEVFAFFIQDEKGQVRGGCNGVILYGCMHVDQLWLEDSLRNQGYGTELMEAAEKFGRERNCPFSTVNTMDWEALGFYQKLGYYIEFERHGYSKDSIFYFLRKGLI